MQCRRPWFDSWVGIPWRSFRLPTPVFLDFPGGLDGEESACNVGDLGLMSGLGRSPWGGHGNPLQYSGLKNPHGQRSLAGYNPSQKVRHSWVTKHTAQLIYSMHSIFYLLIPYPILLLPTSLFSLVITSFELPINSELYVEVVDFTLDQRS